MKFLQQLARKQDDRGQKIVYNFVHQTISYTEEGKRGRGGGEKRSEIKIIESNILQFLIGVC